MLSSMESSTRSLAKAISYRLLGSMSTAALIFVVSGDWKMSAGAGLLDSVVKLGLYFVHERVWSRIPYGQATEPDYQPRQNSDAPARCA